MDENEKNAIIAGDSDDDSRGELQLRSATQIEAYRGPLPPPKALREYEAALPGSAERILARLERETAHRHDMQRGTLELQTFDVRSAYRRSNLGLYLGALVALAVVAVGAYLAFLGYPAEGAGVVISTVVGLAATFVYGARIRGREGDSDEQQ